MSKVAAEFCEQVYALVRTIPPGRVMGYGQVAAAIGFPGRARHVGFALGDLPPDTDVPWHRVLRASGHIAMQGDLFRPLLQQARLRAEGVVIRADKVEMRRFGWSG